MKHKAKIAGSENDIETEVVMLNIGDVKITFLDAQGNPARRGSGEPLYRHSFTVEGPGIDPLRVKRVMIPPLDYGNPEVLMVKVEMYPWNPADFAPKEWFAESKGKLDATPLSEEVQINDHIYTMTPDFMILCKHCGARAKFNESQSILHAPDCPYHGKGY